MKDGLFEVGDEVFQIGFTPANTKRMIVEQVYARGNKPHYEKRLEHELDFARLPHFEKDGEKYYYVEQIHLYKNVTQGEPA